MQARRGHARGGCKRWSTVAVAVKNGRGRLSRKEALSLSTKEKERERELSNANRPFFRRCRARFSLISRGSALVGSVFFSSHGGGISILFPVGLPCC